MIQPLPDDEIRILAERYIALGCNLSALSREDGRARGTLYSHIKRAARLGFLPISENMPGFEITRVSQGPHGTTIEQKQERGEEFKVPEGHAIKGVSTLVDASGRTVTQWIKTKQGELSPEAIVKAIRDALEGFSHEASDTGVYSAQEHDTATIYPLADLHLGMMAWKPEAGENFDLSIAEKTVKASMSRLFSSAPNSKTCVVLGLGDLLHYDGYEPVTSRSKNFLDVDGRYPRVLQVATSILVWIVDQAMRKHENVILRVLPGNHDDQSAIAISLALSMYYRNVPRVQVDTDPSRFWWWRFGTTFIGATHGDMAKMADLPLIMASSKPDDWGASKHRHIYTGHIHHKSAVKEIGNVIVESFRSPAARDAWHAGAGYISGRSLQAITFHADHGEISRQTANIIEATA